MIKNKWKLAFIVLVALLLITFFVIFSLINSPIEDEQIKTLNSQSSSVKFEVASNKSDLNLLINNYLKKEVGKSPVDYKIVLDNEVELYGTIPFFSEKLDMKMTFEPRAMDNGDLTLKQKSIQVGSIDLPVSYVLNFIRENYKFPRGVTIQPKKEQIYIAMSEIKLKSDTKIKVNEFDLNTDDISFTLLVPVE